MKSSLRLVRFLGLGLICSLSAVSALQAQVAISNLGQSVGATGTIGRYSGGGEEWRRVFTFTTGASVGGYDFTGITMSFNAAAGSPGALSVSLYSTFDANTTAGGGTLVSALSLSSGSPLAGPTATYSGTATLAASTTYYLQLSSAFASAGNYYSYPVASTGQEDAGGLAGWSIGDVAYESNYNQLWTAQSGPGLFSVDATAAIPEPSTYVLMFGLAALGVVLWRRKSATASV